jgi:putative hydrolase of the HAD superfamily
VKYRAVVFDLWNTLSLWAQDDLYVAMAEHLGVEHEEFTEVWLEGYEQRATGPLEPSVRAACEKLRVSSDRIGGILTVRLEATRQSLVPREGALEVLRELRRRGYRLGLITVCSEEVPRLWSETTLAPLIDEAVFSCSVGVAKPDRRIYEIAAERLGVEPRECVFIDDQPEFVRGAVEAEMDAYVLGEPPVERLEDVLELAQ